MRIRPAQRSDVPAIVALLAADQIGARREAATDPLPEAYYGAFDRIAADPGSHLMVAEVDGRVAGTFQLNFIPYLTQGGRDRAQIEAVRVADGARGAGIGTRMLEWAIEQARRHGCGTVQLTSNKERTEARRLYERLGFRATHEGFKLPLRP